MQPAYLDPAYSGAQTSTTAPAWRWYIAYVIVMALLYVFCLLVGIAYLAGAGFLPVRSQEQVMLGVYGVLFTVLGGVFMLLYGAAPFLPKKRWAWIYHLVLIGFGLTNCCTMPAAIPLLIAWLKPETKAMFGYS